MDSNTHVGTVVSTAGEYATVRFERGEMCAHCGACHMTAGNQMEIRARNLADAVKGDKVILSLAGGKVAKASLWAYALPCTLLIAGIVLGCMISEIVGLVVGLITCAGAFGILYYMNRKWAKHKTYEPCIADILIEEEQ